MVRREQLSSEGVGSVGSVGSAGTKDTAATNSLSNYGSNGSNGSNGFKTGSNGAAPQPEPGPKPGMLLDDEEAGGPLGDPADSKAYLTSWDDVTASSDAQSEWTTGDSVL